MRLGSVSISRDAVAGVVTACVVIPQCVAYASLAGLPAEAGLYVATLPLAVYALLGSSRVMSVTVTSTISVLTGTIIVHAGGDPRENAAALAILVGVMLLAVGLLKLGFVLNIISSPVLTGFKAGVGLVVVSSELGKVLGIPVNGDNFVENVDDLLHGLDDIQWRTFALALSCAVILLGLKRFAPRVPGALVVVVFGIAMVRLQDLSAKGVAVLGTVDDGLPSLGFPDPKGWWILVPGAAAIALMSGLESATAAKILRRPQDPEIDANRELNATGAMNVAAGFVGAYPGGGGLSQSVVNSNAGATSQLSSLTTAVCAVIVLTVATGLLEDLPQAALGVIVIVAVSSFLDPRPLIAMSRVRTRDFGLAIVALVCACLFGMLEGVLVSLIVSVLVLMYQVNKVTIEDVTPPDLDGLMALRPRGLLYFANVQAVNDRTLRMVLDAQPRPRIVIIDFISVQDLEITALDSSRKLVDELLDAGIEPWAAGFSPGEAGMVGRYGPRQELRIFATLDDAIATYRRELDRGQ